MISVKRFFEMLSKPGLKIFMFFGGFFQTSFGFWGRGFADFLEERVAAYVGILSFFASWRRARVPILFRILPFLVIISLQWLFQINSDGTGYLAQRSMACLTDQDARVAALVFVWIQIFVRSLLWLIIAVGLLIIYPIMPESMLWDKYVCFQRDDLYSRSK